MCTWFNGGGFGGGIFMMIMMALFWGLIIWGVFTLVRRFPRSNHDQGHNALQSPLDILKQRYAKGEITQEEFEHMKKDLT